MAKAHGGIHPVKVAPLSTAAAALGSFEDALDADEPMPLGGPLRRDDINVEAQRHLNEVVQSASQREPVPLSSHKGRSLALLLVAHHGSSGRALFLGLDDRDPIGSKTLEPHILIETTPAGEGIACQMHEAFIMRLTLKGVAQEADVTGRIEYEEVFDRVALFLATVVFLLLLGIGRAVDGSLRAIMPTRGGVGTTLLRTAASHTAKSSAVRAGSNS
jgi:hypothetical protein